ncbi:hypothetical protein Taro_029308 [Colocasia esculenta]|uniref:Uncharacterized protein n=1 Tax=Colocasia esculenta TaxID=4460 RepID=A0A843VWV0_COLES|nr:hypothetical protein [Colocasia esculenta]
MTRLTGVSRPTSRLQIGSTEADGFGPTLSPTMCTCSPLPSSGRGRADQLALCPASLRRVGSGCGEEGDGVVACRVDEVEDDTGWCVLISGSCGEYAVRSRGPTGQCVEEGRGGGDDIGGEGKCNMTWSLLDLELALTCFYTGDRAEDCHQPGESLARAGRHGCNVDRLVAPPSGDDSSRGGPAEPSTTEVARLCTQVETSAVEVARWRIQVEAAVSQVGELTRELATLRAQGLSVDQAELTQLRIKLAVQ